ncbi:Plasmodium vivax Vir protein, putative [Plasmodium ovale]|uniref:Plasmodium vivax Vir protein, putative n=1 Tax=Plasmodium ovale TaxID=36330 RepID=A0A1C3KHZ8_PLAOA|nr:Plasmodium vivax Vir protein, putative [Plasmodium ovale]
MVSKSDDPFFNSWEIKYPFLLGSPLYLIYLLFSRDYTAVHSDNPICNIHIKEDTSQESGIHSICLNLQKLLESLSDFIESEVLDYDVFCKYVSYFLHEKIKDISTRNNLDGLYGALNYIIKYILNVSTCQITQFKNEEFDKKKELYFRSEILNWVQNNHNDIHYTEDLCDKFIDESVQFYNKNVKDNYCKYKQYYKDELENFVNIFNKTKKILGRNGISISEKDLSLPQMSTCSSQDHRNGLENTEAIVLPSVDQKESPVFHNPDESIQEDSTNSNRNITSTILGITSGMILIIFFLYKFTPFGAWLHDSILKKKRIRSYIEEEKDDLLENTYESKNKNKYETVHHIGYH